MSRISSVDFEVLDASGKNYLAWQSDVQLHLLSLGLDSYVLADVVATAENKEKVGMDKGKAVIYIRRHMDKTLKFEYLSTKDPFKLWTSLSERFAHQKNVILPRARYEWENLRLQDFKSVAEYNSALFNITSRLELCGEAVTEERILEKTFTSFHEKDVILMQQYRERGFKKYSDLHSCLLVAEQNKELLLTTHNLRPAGTAPLPEHHNVISQQGRKRKNNFPNNRGRNDRNAYQKPRHNNHKKKPFRKRNNTWQRNPNEQNANPIPPQKKEWLGTCQRCGMVGHFSSSCRTPRYFQDLYLETQKRKHETNMVDTNMAASGDESPRKLDALNFTAEDFANDDLLD